MSTAEIADTLTATTEPTLPGMDVPFREGYVLPLKKRFLLPPFTVLDAKAGPWQDRKRKWLDLGLKSEEGRDARMLAKSVSDEWVIDPETGEEYLKGAPPGSVNAKILALSNGQSIFDPVLCELAYSWLCPEGGVVLDPFAGGSVRGLVAGILGRRYYGIDLSARQIAANQDQAADFFDRGLLDASLLPSWIEGDSNNVLWVNDDDLPEEVDFVWSCPPYHDLEVYSDDPADLSNMPWDKFCEVYGSIIEGALARLKPNRFAAFVVGEIREPGNQQGYYRNFVGETIRAFEAAEDVHYYNEMILVMPAGTLPLRTAKQFMVSRKMGRTHQTILVFVKGDPRKAAAECLDVASVEAAIGRPVEELSDVPDDPRADTMPLVHG